LLDALQARPESSFPVIADRYTAAASAPVASRPGKVLAGFGGEPANVLAHLPPQPPARSADSMGGDASEPGGPWPHLPGALRRMG
jgi:hypothetical protein